MNLFREPLLQLSEYESIQKNLSDNKGPVYVEGCVDAQKTHWMASFAEEYPFRLIITHSEKRIIVFLIKMCGIIRPGTLFFTAQMSMVRRWSENGWLSFKNFLNMSR